MFTPLSSIVHNENQNNNSLSQNISDKTANNMPNGLMRVSEPQNSKNIANKLNNQQLKQIYTAKLSPSVGSLTESFIKAKINYLFSMTPLREFASSLEKARGLSQII